MNGEYYSFDLIIINHFSYWHIRDVITTIIAFIRMNDYFAKLIFLAADMARQWLSKIVGMRNR